MSLINDALKKASHANKQKQAESPSSVPQSPVAPPMQATEHRPTSSFPVVPILIVLVVIGIGAFGVVLFSGKKGGAQGVVPPVVRNETVATAPAPQAAPVPEKPTAAPVPPAPPKPPSPPTPVAVTVAEPVSAPTTAAISSAPVTTPATAPVVAAQSVPEPEPVVAAPAPPPVPKFPLIKLQGVFYKKNNPTAMLNGITLAVGGKVDGVTVTKIEQSAVTLDWNGETKVLELR